MSAGQIQAFSKLGPPLRPYGPDLKDSHIPWQRSAMQLLGIGANTLTWRESVSTPSKRGKLKLRHSPNLKAGGVMLLAQAQVRGTEAVSIAQSSVSWAAAPQLLLGPVLVHSRLSWGPSSQRSSPVL